ncbi:MAG: NHL repeat containing [Candidatus Magnetoglobus multicellularis str. Araruama]|uniref:NHL repeat containing n=1 Tax=Candidatus Magnetoglobus multicellularis str. Araruama TaxID=890399 RepID=A0A1V1PDU0_9BACT|nr:MAG: NHL repeat containing [Candidatus Magnetoglobus multicellularis str. Araruama]
MDHEENIFATDHIAHCIRKFDRNGTPLQKWGSYGSSPGQFWYPAGIDVYLDTVFVSDANDRIQKFSLDGRFLDTWGERGSSAGKFNKPQGLAVDADGFLYVADTLNHRIQKFDNQGTFIVEWGDYGNANGEFSEPSGVAVDHNKHVFVVDQNNNRIQKFDSTGIYLAQWGTEGIEQAEFSYPSEISLDRDGYVYVADTFNDRIQKFSSSGAFMAEWGISGNNPGEMDSPRAIDIHQNGRVIVADTRNNRIQIFRNADLPDYKAIIVAGGGPYAGNNLWASTQMCANFAYRALVYQGLNKNNIQYLSSNKDLNVSSNALINGPAAMDNLKNAILNWSTDADRLVLYMIDHGGDGVFRLNDESILQSQKLDAWLDQIQEHTGMQVIVIYDACKSGSFVDDLIPPETLDRVVITSSQEDENAYFVSQGAISFSIFFWTQIFNGSSLWEAFSIARDAMNAPVSYQTAMLDDNGNGIANESDDGLIANNVFIGNGVQLSGDSPIINIVSPDQVISNDSKAKIYADNIHDPDGIARVWAVIRPPQYQPNPYFHPIQDLPSIELTYNSPGRYEATYQDFHTEGVYQVAIYAMDRMGNTSPPKMTTVSITQPLSDKVILVAGAPNEHTTRQAIDRNAKLAYDSLIFQGYASKDITFLCPSENNIVADALPGIDNFKNAITNIDDHTKDVLIYFIGNGDNATFQINADEYISAKEMDNWLDTIKPNIQGYLTFIYDADCAGSFIAHLTETGSPQRILITSTGKSGIANNGANGALSFSSFFWQRIFSGDTTRQAFVRSVNALACAFPGQVPMLDDNGNGIPNESGLDGTLAEKHRVGCGIMMADDFPIIGSVSPEISLTSTHTSELYVDSVSSTREILKVWAVINPPSLAYQQLMHQSPPSEIIEMTLSGDRYSCMWDHFDRYGSYQIAFFAEDILNNVSLPVNTTIFQKSCADVYESDNHFDLSQIIVPDNLFAQKHNFHEPDDTDWCLFFGVKDVTYSIEAFDLGNKCDVVLELYKDDGQTLIKGAWNWSGTGTNEFMSWQCPEDNTYYLKIYNHLETSGLDTGYAIKIYRPIGVFPGFISGLIKDSRTNQPVPAVRLRTVNGTGSGISDRNGIYVIVDEEGIYTLDAWVKDYEKFNKNVRIFPLDETPLNIFLNPLDSDGDRIPDQIEINTGTDPDNADTDGDGIMDGLEDTNQDGIWQKGIESDPRNPDTDNDGISDGYELTQDLEIFLNDAFQDKDTDGYCNLTEFNNSTNPNQQDRPGFNGYDYRTDSRTYSLHGNITYNECESGRVYIEVFDTADINVPFYTQTADIFDYYLDIPARDVHYVRIYIDVNKNYLFDSNEPYAFYELPITSISRGRNVTLFSRNSWHFSMSTIDDTGNPISEVIIMKMKKDDRCIGYVSPEMVYNEQTFEIQSEFIDDTLFINAQLGLLETFGKGASIGIGMVGHLALPDHDAPFSYVVNPEEVQTPDLTGFWSITLTYEGKGWDDNLRNGQQTEMINFISEQLDTENVFTGIVENKDQFIRLTANANTIEWQLEQKEDDIVIYHSRGAGTWKQNSVANLPSNKVMGTFAGKSADSSGTHSIDLGHFYAHFTPNPRSQLTVGSPSPIVYSNARFSIPLLMDTGNVPLGTYSTTISFNNNIIELANIHNKIPGIETLPLEEINTTGLITIGDNQNSARTAGPTGVIHLADFEFRVTGSPGTYGIFDIDNTLVLDTLSKPITITNGGGQLYIGPALVNAGDTAPMKIFYESTVEIPITILQAYNQFIGNYSMTFQYDPVLFRPITVIRGASNRHAGDVQFNVDETSGEIHIQGTWPKNEAPINHAEVAKIILKLDSIDEEGLSSPVKLKVQSLKNTDGKSIERYVKGALLDPKLGICGDVNQDNSIDMADSFLLSSYLLGEVSEDDLCLAVADTNDNGRIDIGDSMYIVQYILGKRDCICEDTIREICRNK